MNIYNSWFFSIGYFVKLLEIAATKEKAWHKSKASYFSPMLTWGWLEISRQTAHNTWYQLTDLGLSLEHRFLCAFFERAVRFDELEIALQDYFEKPSEERWAWLNSYRQAQEEHTKQVLAWLDDQRIAYQDADVNDAYIVWAESICIPIWHLPELLLMARDKAKEHERLAQYEAQMAEKLAAYLSTVEEGNLIEEAVYMKKYQFYWDQLEIIRLIVKARYLHNPSFDKSYWHYRDTPLSPEENSEWLQKGRYTAWQAAEKLGISVERFRKLAKLYGVEIFARESRSNNIWGVGCYRAQEVERLRPYTGKVVDPSKRKSADKHLKL